MICLCFDMHANSGRNLTNEEAIIKIVHHIAQSVDIMEDEVIDLLLDREQLGTTGIGAGIAVPHAKGLAHGSRSDTIPDDILAVIKSSIEIEWDALDREPVSVICPVLTHEVGHCIMLLALISRLLRSLGKRKGGAKRKDESKRKGWFTRFLYKRKGRSRTAPLSDDALSDDALSDIALSDIVAQIAGYSKEALPEFRYLPDLIVDNNDAE